MENENTQNITPSDGIPILTTNSGWRKVYLQFNVEDVTYIDGLMSRIKHAMKKRTDFVAE